MLPVIAGAGTERRSSVQTFSFSTPVSDSPATFKGVHAGQFDLGKTNFVQGTWLSGIGCLTNAFIAGPNASFAGVGGTAPHTDAAWPTGAPNDQQNMWLLLAKTGPTANFASATAQLTSVKGMTINELGYDIRGAGGAQRACVARNAVQTPPFLNVGH